MPSRISSAKAIGGPWLVLIALSVGFAAFLLCIHAPAALMLGPLVAGIVVASTGAKVSFPLSPFVLSQGVVGCLVARMVPLSIVDDVLAHWALFSAGVVLVIAASSLMGWLMMRLEVLPGTTGLWGSSAGAASVMTIMAEHYGADPRLVAFMQYLRVVMVAVIAALVARLFGVNPAQASHDIAWFPPVGVWPLLQTLALAIAGPVIARRFKIPAGAFMLPLVSGIVLVHFGLMTIELPPWLLAASYAFIGWNIGLRFTRPLLIHAARTLPVVMAATLALIALCGAVGALMVWGAGVDPLTAYLATSPGGSDSIAIIAASTNVDISFVMAMQTVRMLAVIFIAPFLTKLLAERLS